MVVVFVILPGFSKLTKIQLLALLKKADNIVQVNPNFHTLNINKSMGVRIELACKEAELDEVNSAILGGEAAENVKLSGWATITEIL